jgi:MFS family permease
MSYRTFTKPPYGFKFGFLGLFSVSGFIGAVLATFFGGKLIDIISNQRTSIHKGRREPEYRLYAIFIPAIIGPMGILLFGLTIAVKKPWIEPAIGHAMQGFGLTAVSNLLVTYTMDSYLPIAGEAMVVIFVLRGIIGAVLVLWSLDWIEEVGEKEAFGQMVGIQYFVLMWVVVFLVWGKRIRAMTARYGPTAWDGYNR